jgi:hypothetical protein
MCSYGNIITYKKALNTLGSMSSMRTHVQVLAFSFQGPKSWAMKTGEQAVRTHLCVVNVSPPAPTWNCRKTGRLR